MHFKPFYLIPLLSFSSVMAAPVELTPALAVRATGPADKPYLRKLYLDQYAQGADAFGTFRTQYKAEYILPWLSYANGDSLAIRKATFTTGVADLNMGFGGQFTYLRAEWTNDYTEACTNIKTWHQPKRDPTYDDIASGSGGDFRYITCETIAGQRPLRSLALLRQNSQLDRTKLPPGYKWATADINEGRSSILGQRLYVVFSN